MFSWLQTIDPPLHELQLKRETSRQDALALARALNSRCRHQEVLALVDTLLAEDRSNDDAWFERIVAEGDHTSEDDLDTLHSELESVRVERPDEAAPLRNLGYLRLIQQRTDEAERALRQSLERNGQDPKTLELMGLLCLQQDKTADAKTWFLKALSLQPQDPRSLRLLGIACEQLEDPKGAEAQFSAALQVDPHYFWGWHSLGEFLLRRGRTEEGMRCIHRARSLQPKEPASYFIVSEIFSEQGHLDMAQAELHQVLFLVPPATVAAEAYGLLGEIRRDTGDTEGATSYFSLASEMDQESPNPWIALGDLAREDQRWDDALRCYREALARDPEAADAQIQLGYVLLNGGHHTEAERNFLSALESDPGEYSAYLGLSECYRHMQNHVGQLAMVKEAMTLAPEDPDVWNAQGVAYQVSGKLVEATESYEKALQLSPTHRKAANNLGFILELRMETGEDGLKDRAIEAWKRRLLLCRDEGQSLKMAMEHLTRLGISEETLQRWLEQESTPDLATR